MELTRHRRWKPREAVRDGLVTVCGDDRPRGSLSAFAVAGRSIVDRLTGGSRRSCR